MIKVKTCPISVVSENTCITKKWTLTIIRDLIFGFNRFKDFLNNNAGLSAKVLSERLKEMEDDGLLIKEIISTRPLAVRYTLTEMGKDLNKILYEFSMFGGKHFPIEVFGEVIATSDAVEVFGRNFKLEADYLEFVKQPRIRQVVEAAD